MWTNLVRRGGSSRTQHIAVLSQELRTVATVAMMMARCLGTRSGCGHEQQQEQRAAAESGEVNVRRRRVADFARRC